MKKLILAEKPSVGRDIARALKVGSKGNSFIEGKNYIVTWALGHLVTLANPEIYDKSYATWKIEDLPILPKDLKTIVIKKTSKQFNTIKSLINRNDISEIIIATDAGREGELVARWIIDKIGTKKPIKRLWISSVTDKAIADGFKRLKEGKEYENLYRSAEARAKADWYVGINGTRALTCKYNAQLSCGRVQTPTLEMVNKKDEEIRAFKSRDYFGISANIEGIKFIWYDKNNSSRSFNEEKIDSLIKKLNLSEIEYINSNTKRKRQYPQGLYDLTELQKDANRIYGFSGKETLNAMQSLYESHKALTYPRTDSRYITSDIVETLKDRVRACSIDEFRGVANRIYKGNIKGNKSFVDDKKVSDHHAIIPTEERPLMDRLNDREWKIYSLVVKRFLSVLMSPYEYDETTVEVILSGEKFVSKSNVVVNKGWKEIYKEDMDNSVKSIDINENSKVRIEKTSGKTSPPSRYTEGTLLSAMENPAKYIDIRDKKAVKTLGKTGGIGTVATRADILDKLFNSFLIEKREQDIYITSKGKQLLKLVPEDLKSPILTAEWENKLEKISSGELSANKFLNDIKSYTKDIVREIKSDDSKFRHDNITGSKCPDCGKYMLEVNSKKGRMLVCQDRECGHRETISIVTNARCPECKKKMELRGRGDSKTFYCKCGYREKLSTFNKRKEARGKSVSKKEVNSYLKKQKDESINSALAEALAKLKL